MSIQTERNKEVVKDFYDLIINKKDYKTAKEKYIGDRYTQHNPLVEDGPEGLGKFINFLANNYPNAYSTIEHIYVDGDYVILHVHSIRDLGTRGRAIIEIFKLENEKVVEHWDVIQEIPEKSACNRSMF